MFQQRGSAFGEEVAAEAALRGEKVGGVCGLAGRDPSPGSPWDPRAPGCRGWMCTGGPVAPMGRAVPGRAAARPKAVVGFGKRGETCIRHVVGQEEGRGPGPSLASAALQKLVSVIFGWAASCSAEGWVPTQPSAAGKQVGNVKLWRRAKGTKCLGLMLETFPRVTPISLGEGELSAS